MIMEEEWGVQGLSESRNKIHEANTQEEEEHRQSIIAQKG